MQGPVVQTNRPRACLVPRPAREMSRRGLVWLGVAYAALFAAAILHRLLS